MKLSPYQSFIKYLLIQQIHMKSSINISTHRISKTVDKIFTWLTNHKYVQVINRNHIPRQTINITVSDFQIKKIATETWRNDWTKDSTLGLHGFPVSNILKRKITAIKEKIVSLQLIKNRKDWVTNIESTFKRQHFRCKTVYF